MLLTRHVQCFTWLIVIRCKVNRLLYRITWHRLNRNINDNWLLFQKGVRICSNIDNGSESNHDSNWLDEISNSSLINLNSSKLDKSLHLVFVICIAHHWNWIMGWKFGLQGEKRSKLVRWPFDKWFVDKRDIQHNRKCYN